MRSRVSRILIRLWKSNVWNGLNDALFEQLPFSLAQHFGKKKPKNDISETASRSGSDLSSNQIGLCTQLEPRVTGQGLKKTLHMLWNLRLFYSRGLLQEDEKLMQGA